MGSSANTALVASALLICSGACGHDWEALSNDATTGTTGPGGGANGGEGGLGGVGGQGAMGGVGLMGAGGSTGGEGGTGGALSDDGLVVRYYLDEAPGGVMPTSALDAAPMPLSVPIQYDSGLTYATEDAQRGLHWPTEGEDGLPTILVDGTKLMDFNGSTTGTIEAVARVERVHASGSRLMHIGLDTDWSFSIGISFPQVDKLIQTGPPTRFVASGATSLGGYDAFFNYDFVPTDRFVVHKVFDSNDSVEENRVRVYVNGVRLAANAGSTYPVLDEPILLVGDESLGVGNRLIGSRSVLGTVFYGAYYTRAMSDATIAEHTAVLLVNDDTP